MAMEVIRKSLIFRQEGEGYGVFIKMLGYTDATGKHDHATKVDDAIHIGYASEEELGPFVRVAKHANFHQIEVINEVKE